MFAVGDKVVCVWLEPGYDETSPTIGRVYTVSEVAIGYNGSNEHGECLDLVEWPSGPDDLWMGECFRKI